MRAIVILNEQSGTAVRAREPVTAARLQTAFAGAHIDAAVQLIAPDQLATAVTRAIAERPDAIFVGGGDGSISTSAGLLAGTDIPFGVLPLGTLNHFAKDLGLPMDYAETITALAPGISRQVDVAEVNGRVFINNCSIGAYADAVHRREALRRLHGHGKWPAMFRASLAVFRRLRSLRATLETDQASRVIRSPFIFIANNRYSGSLLQKNLRERLDEGQLWIYTTRAHRHLTILRLAWQTIRRSLDTADAMDAVPTTRATLQFPAPSIALAVDGELLHLDTPLNISIRPRALRLLVPASTSS